MIRDGFVAIWAGQEFDASPDADRVRLYRPDAADGFEQVRPGRYRRIVALTEVSDLRYVRTACTWKGHPFIVVGAHGAWLRLEYTGGLAPVAAELGLEEFESGVHQAWAAEADVSDLRQYRL